MGVFEWVAISLGTLLLLVTMARAFRLRRRNVPLWIAHLLISAILFLTIEDIYLPVDAALGGWNGANLFSRVALALVFLGLCTQALQGLDRPDLQRLVSGPLGLSVLITGTLAVIGSFAMIGADTSNMGLNAYQQDTWVAIYRGSAGIYPSYCSIIMLIGLRDDSRRGLGLKTHAAAKRLLTVGFALAPVVMLLTFLEVSDLPARLLVDLLTYLSIAAVLFGTATMLVTRQLNGQTRKSRLRA